MKHVYHRITVKHEEYPKFYSDETGPNDWPLSRYMKLLQLRQNALEEARAQWADYLLVCFYGNVLLICFYGI